jgi:hypothetical protein
VASDQMLPALADFKIAPPGGVGEERYYLYRFRR